MRLKTKEWFKYIKILLGINLLNNCCTGVSLLNFCP